MGYNTLVVEALNRNGKTEN